MNQNLHFLPSHPKKADNAHMGMAAHHPPNIVPRTIVSIPNTRSPADTIYNSVLIGRNIRIPPQHKVGI